MIFVRKPKATLEDEIVFLAKHLDWFLKPTAKYFNCLWLAQIILLALLPVFVVVSFFTSVDGTEGVLFLISYGIVAVSLLDVCIKRDLAKLVLIKHIKGMYKD